MREQMVIPRTGNRGSATGEKWRSVGEQAQRPSRRSPRAGGATTGARSSGKLKAWFAFAPLVGRILLVLVACVLLIKGYRVASAASLFQLRHVDVSGAAHSSTDEIQAITKRAAGTGGVWKSDLDAIGAEIKREQGWVREAVVTRVLPDGLRVRISEREPRTVVRTTQGQLMWVDDEGITLGQASTASAQLPAFFIHGLDEANTDAARRENRERMQKYAQMAREWEAANLSERISEVNLMDIHDVRAQLAGNDSRIEVRLGKENFGQRLARALKVLDEQRHTPRGSLITRLDATLEHRVIVGFSTGAQQQEEASETRVGGAAAKK